MEWLHRNGETGIEVTNKDAIAYAEAIDRLLADDELTKRMGTAGHQRVVENFTIPKMVERMEECYKELLPQ